MSKRSFCYRSGFIRPMASIAVMAIISSCSLVSSFGQDKPAEAPAEPAAAAPEAAPEKKPEESKPAKAPAKKQVRVLALSGEYVDLQGASAFNPADLILGGGGGKPKSFYKLCDYLDELSHEELVTHVVFDLSSSSLSMNPAQLDEFSRRLSHLRGHGKKCIAWLESASNVHLSIASGCDEVLLADLGGIDMPSSSMETMFYRDAMD
ncbi:MAG: hypothetical protein ACKOOI_09245, partial [Pirellula sp.]